MDLNAKIWLAWLIIIVACHALKLDFFLHAYIRSFFYLWLRQILEFRWCYTHNSGVINNLLSLKDAKISSELLLAEDYLFNVINLWIDE